MIITKGNKPKVINPEQIIYMELEKGKVSAFATGDNDGDVVIVKDLKVREPWAVMIKTAVSTHYINCKDFETALSTLVSISCRVTAGLNKENFEKDLRAVYGKERS